MENLFNDVMDILFPVIFPYLFMPKYKLVMVNNPNEIVYKDFSKYDLPFYFSIPVESEDLCNQFPYQKNIHNVSIDGGGRFGCKMKFIYFRKNMEINNFLSSFMAINKNLARVVNKIQLLNPPFLKKMKIKDNLKYKLLIQKIYQKYPHFYDKYFECDYHIPKDHYYYRNKKCDCYHAYKCDLCLLGTWRKINDHRYGEMIMCYNCLLEMKERRREYYEHKRYS